jgi:hypothetical protein
LLRRKNDQVYKGELARVATDMQKNYKEKIWQLFKENKISFTYRSQFKKNIDEFLEELQALIFSKVWNEKIEITRAYVLRVTKHQRYHYKQQCLLCDLHVRKKLH